MYLLEIEYSFQVLLATFNLNIPIRKFEAIHIRNAHANGMKKKENLMQRKLCMVFSMCFPTSIKTKQDNKLEGDYFK